MQLTADGSGRTAFSYAIERARSDVFEDLLERGANIESRDNSGRTPLFDVTENKWDNGAQYVNLLLQRGSDVESKDYSGRTALHYAASTSRREVGKQLLAMGADLEASDNDGRTPIDIARRSGLEKVVAAFERATEEHWEAQSTEGSVSGEQEMV